MKFFLAQLTPFIGKTPLLGRRLAREEGILAGIYLSTALFQNGV